MPDCDVYDRHVPRGWKTAARIVFTNHDEGVAREKLLRALGDTIKQGGCPGIDQVTSLVAEALECSDTVKARNNEVKRQLQYITSRYSNYRTEMLAEVARKVLLCPKLQFPDTIGREQIKLEVARVFLVRLVKSNISPQALENALCREDELSPVEYGQHIGRFERLLADSPEMNILAARLLAAPSGEGIKIPPVRAPKLSMEEIMALHLTS